MQEVDGAGVFEAFLPRRKPPLEYRLEATWLDGSTFAYDDPYAFPPTLGDVDLYLIGEGRHEELYDVLGAHERELEGHRGTSFAVWAPAARSVSVVGDFNNWDGRVHQLQIARVERRLGALRPGDRAGQPLQVRDPPRERAAAPEGRPARLRRRAAAGERLDRLPVAVRVERRRVAREARAHRGLGEPDVGLRGASRRRGG